MEKRLQKILKTIPSLVAIFFSQYGFAGPKSDISLSNPKLSKIQALQQIQTTTNSELSEKLKGLSFCDHDKNNENKESKNKDQVSSCEQADAENSTIVWASGSKATEALNTLDLDNNKLKSICIKGSISKEYIEDLRKKLSRAHYSLIYTKFGNHVNGFAIVNSRIKNVHGQDFNEMHIDLICTDTSAPGLGKRLMQDIINPKSQKVDLVTLNATGGAADFYIKMGYFEAVPENYSIFDEEQLPVYAKLSSAGEARMGPILQGYETLPMEEKTEQVKRIIFDHKNSKLRQIAKEGSLTQFREFVQQEHADLNYVGADGRSVFNVAADSKNDPLVDYLLKHQNLDISQIKINQNWNEEIKKTIIHKKSKNKNAILYKAAYRLDASAIDELINLGANIHYEGSSGESVLMAASKGGNVEGVRKLIEKGADVNHTTLEGYTPIFSAVYSGNFDTVKLLIDKKANVNCSDEHGFTPFLISLISRKYKIAQLLIDSKVTIDSKSASGYTALHNRVATGDVIGVKFLIKNKANVNTPTNEGEIPLSIAAERFVESSNGLDSEQSKKTYYEIMEMLVREGAEVNTRVQGDSLIQWAANKGSLELVKFLLKQPKLDLTKVEIRSNWNSKISEMIAQAKQTHMSR